MAYIPRIAAVLGLATVVGCLLPTASFSSDPQASSSKSQPGQTIPQADRDSGSGSSAPLGDRLERSNGVIRPPSGVDPGLAEPPPESGSRTPVIPPPGTPGGSREVNPK
jgi:hypothetical protein